MISSESAPDACEVVAFEPPRFDVDTSAPQLAAYLEEHGFAVVADVFGGDADALARAKAAQWSFLEALPGATVRRDNPATWDSEWLPNPSNGILHGFGFGQSEAQWALRLLPRVRRAFAAVWRTDDLLVSFDGANLVRPGRARRTRGGWWHVDQNALRAGQGGRCCVQGLVTLTDATAATGGLCVIPRSHCDFEALCVRSPLARAKGAFVPVDARDAVLRSGGVLVCARAGDAILWDSRTVHCNTPPLVEGDERPDALLRQVSYVCMTPARWASERTLASRRDAYENNVSTSHWPHEFVIAGVGLPDTPPNDPEAASPEKRRLIGYDRPELAARCGVM